MTKFKGVDNLGLLERLARERDKLIDSDKSSMEEMVEELVHCGVYPAMTPEAAAHGLTHLKMVEGWGAYWHRWDDPLECPLCGADLCDHITGPPFKREIGISDPDADAVVEVKCPDCKGVIWGRAGGSRRAACRTGSSRAGSSAPARRRTRRRRTAG